MSRAVFGTNAISGLNVGQAAHLIADHELTVSLNGWTDEEGSWKTAYGPEILYTGYSAISCFASGRMGGADHCVWLDGNTLYDNGVSVGTITAGSDMTVKSVDDGFLVLGAGKIYLYDGNHVRELGTWQFDIMSLTGLSEYAAASDSITAITNAANAAVTTTNRIYADPGEYVYITGVLGMTEINGFHEVVSVSGSGPYVYVLDVDSSDFGTYTSAGTAYGGACGLDGDYKYYFVPTLTLSDESILLGRPRGVRLNGRGKTYSATDPWEASAIPLSPENGISIKASIYWVYASADVFSITGTRGTDYTPGLRLYRTKADGEDFYLEREWSHGDADFVYTAAGTTGVYKIDTYYGGATDSDLGAVYSADFGDHDNPQNSSIMAAVGQRLYSAVGEKVYWSHLDGIEFWNDLDYITVPDVVTALAPIRGMLAIMSSDRLWVMDMSSGLPDIREIDTPAGTAFPKAMVTVDAGLLFLREDGLWLFDGSSVNCISRKAFSYLSSPKSICASGDTIYMSGEAYSYVVRVRDGGWVWHGGDGTYDLADATGGSIYAASATTVSRLFSGAPVGGILTTKLFGGLDESKAYRVILDVEGESRPTVSINGTRQSDIIPHSEPFPVTTSGRRVIRFPLPRLSNPFFTMTVATSGDLKIHGFIVEAC